MVGTPYHIVCPASFFISLNGLGFIFIGAKVTFNPSKYELAYFAGNILRELQRFSHIMYLYSQII